MSIASIHPSATPNRPSIGPFVCQSIHQFWQSLAQWRAPKCPRTFTVSESFHAICHLIANPSIHLSTHWALLYPVVRPCVYCIRLSIHSSIHPSMIYLSTFVLCPLGACFVCYCHSPKTASYILLIIDYWVLVDWWYHDLICDRSYVHCCGWRGAGTRTTRAIWIYRRLDSFVCWEVWV